MTFKKRGLGRGLEALLADVSAKNELSASIGENMRQSDIECVPCQEPLKIIESPSVASGLLGFELKKYQKVAEQSRKRAEQLQKLQELPAVNIDLDGLSSVVRILIEDVQRDNLSLLEEAEALLHLFDEFESIVTGQ
jgi:ParB family transcriptional regulator, chromosome partitioning protein